MTSCADDASDDASPQTDAAVLQPESTQQTPRAISDESCIAALAEQVLSASTSSVSDTPEPPDEPGSDPIPRVDILPGLLMREADAEPKPIAVMASVLPGTPALRQPARELRLAARGEAMPNSEARAVAADASLSERIADTPVMVREQQTHFSREPIGRSAATMKSDGTESPAPRMDREAAGPSRNITRPQAIATNAEPVQLGVMQAKGAVEQSADDTTDDAAPSVQLLGKLLDVCHEEKAAARAQAPSNPWLPAERPFGSLMRQIRLELSPASLGVVHITLKGVNSALKISIEAERSQTAASLTADRSVLSSSLTEAGYTIDDLIVTTLDRPMDIAPSSRSDQTTGSSNGQPATTSNGSENRQADDGWRRARPERDHAPRSEAQEATQPNPASSSDPQHVSSTAWRGRHVIRSI